MKSYVQMIIVSLLQKVIEVVFFHSAQIVAAGCAENSSVSSFFRSPQHHHPH